MTFEPSEYVTLELLGVLAALNPVDREIYVDRLLLDRTDSEIAADLGITRGRVWQRNARAAKHVRRRLRPLRDRLAA